MVGSIRLELATNQSRTPAASQVSVNMPMEDLTKLERRLLEWIKKSDFETVGWDSKRAAEAFEVSREEILEALAALTLKVPNNIYVHYEDGAIRISAE